MHVIVLVEQAPDTHSGPTGLVGDAWRATAVRAFP